ncbi:MAG: L,D-transpeptidase family protein [Lysobacter sp.]
MTALIAGCASTRADHARDGTTQLQLVLVETADWNATQGRLQRYLFDGTQWLTVGAPVEVTIGRSGSAWGRGLRPAPDDGGPRKREGDGRAPAGMFRIGTAFGYAERASTALAYAPMSASDYCIDVVDSPLYNRIVDVKREAPEEVKGTTEPMRRDLHAGGDQRYRQGFVIEHNAERIAGAGSCIFAHLWKAPGETTAGCTAMDDAAMTELLAWLRPQARPVFVLLPRAQYAQVWRGWGLPEPVAGR